MISPCACKGSIKYVHIHCLKQWIKINPLYQKCMICGTNYKLNSAIYRCLKRYSITNIIINCFLIWLSITNNYLNEDFMRSHCPERMNDYIVHIFISYFPLRMIYFFLESFIWLVCISGPIKINSILGIKFFTNFFDLERVLLTCAMANLNIMSSYPFQCDIDSNPFTGFHYVMGVVTIFIFAGSVRKCFRYNMKTFKYLIL